MDTVIGYGYSSSKWITDTVGANNLVSISIPGRFPQTKQWISMEYCTTYYSTTRQKMSSLVLTDEAVDHSSAQSLTIYPRQKMSSLVPTDEAGDHGVTELLTIYHRQKMSSLVPTVEAGDHGVALSC